MSAKRYNAYRKDKIPLLQTGSQHKYLHINYQIHSHTHSFIIIIIYQKKIFQLSIISSTWKIISNRHQSNLFQII